MWIDQSEIKTTTNYNFNHNLSMKRFYIYKIDSSSEASIESEYVVSNSSSSTQNHVVKPALTGSYLMDDELHMVNKPNRN